MPQMHLGLSEDTTCTRHIRTRADSGAVKQRPDWPDRYVEKTELGNDRSKKRQFGNGAYIEYTTTNHTWIQVANDSTTNDTVPIILAHQRRRGTSIDHLQSPSAKEGA